MSHDAVGIDLRFEGTGCLGVASGVKGQAEDPNRPAPANRAVTVALTSHTFADPQPRLPACTVGPRPCQTGATPTLPGSPEGPAEEVEVAPNPKPQARHREVSAGHNPPKPWTCAPPVADLLFLGASDASPHNVWGLGPRLWADTPVASGANQWLPSSVRLPGWSLVLQLLVFAPPLAGRTVHWHPSPSGC